MSATKRIINLFKYGVGPRARERKRAKKAEQKRAAFQSPIWDHDGELAKRKYQSYQEYVEHQASKLDKVIHRLKEHEDDELVCFRERFQDCKALREVRSVLCLGARLGTEVKALHSLGYFAVGIDLNPGENNPCVLPGDFHQVVFPDGAVDAIYCNALDHVFDLEKMIDEVSRLLRPGGLFLAEIEIGYGEGHVPGDYEATHWRNADEFLKKIEQLGGFDREQLQELGQTRRGQRRLATLRKRG